jgi:hypothetical protein
MRVASDAQNIPALSVLLAAVQCPRERDSDYGPIFMAPMTERGAATARVVRPRLGLPGGEPAG